MKRRNRRHIGSGRNVATLTTAGAPVEAMERRQLLSASLSVSSGLMVFNAVNGNTSVTETLTLTNTGDAALTLGPTAFTLAGGRPAQFALPDAATAPATLAPGDNFGLTMTYHPNQVGRQSTTLTIATNDPAHPTQTVPLSGIGTVGTYGSNQPSLARILRAYNIPTIVGEGYNDAGEATDSVYPNPPDTSSQEVTLQRLVKAGAGPVTIRVLASFDAAAAEPYTLGYYTAGTPAAKTELFYTPTSQSQSVYIQPQGSTSFDPGATPFGMYFVSNIKDNGANRVGYSEDSLNTFDTTNDRKFRFFPMENPDGSVVANSYVMTSTEYNAPAGYDFTNVVAIISNVTAAPGAPVAPKLTVVDPAALPGSTNVAFTNIRFPNSTLGDVVHNTDTLTLDNTGQSPLTITGLTVANSSWTVSSAALPITVPAGGSTPVKLTYNDRLTPATSYDQTSDPNNPGGGGTETGTLTIASNDPVTPSKVLTLVGYTQYHSENSNEPSLQTIVNLLGGWGTNINSTPVSTLNEGQSTTTSTPVYYGEETVSAYWTAADASRPVNVEQIAAYHTEGDADTFSYYKQGTTSYTTVLNQAADDGQTLFPLSSSGTIAAGGFTTTNTFGFRVSGSAGTEYSDDAKNATKTGGGHHFRFYPVRTSAGLLVPGTYVVAMDYSDPTDQNFDFQDNVYLITNIRPASSPALAPAVPTDASAVTVAGGTQVTWAPSLTAGVGGYNLYSSTTATGTYAKLNTAALIAGTSYLDTTTTAGPAYYRVTAVDGTTGAESIGAPAVLAASAVASPGTTSTIGGTVFDDTNANGAHDGGEAGVSGVAVFVDVNHNGVYDPGVDPISVSSSTGAWSIVGLNPGTYTVLSLVPAGETRTVPGAGSYTVTVGANQAVLNKDFGYSRPGVISGTIFYDVNHNGTLDGGEPGLGGYQMFVDNNRNGVYDAGIDTYFTADGNGHYTTSPLPVGTYEVAEAPVAGWGTETAPMVVSVTEGGTTTVNFGQTRASVAGTAYLDANRDGVQDGGEAGLSGYSVYLDFHGTGLYAPPDLVVQTDPNGNWLITGMLPGNYVVNAFTPSGQARTVPTAGSYMVTVAAGQAVTGLNFGYFNYATPSAILATPAAAVAPTPSPFATGGPSLADSVDALIA